MSAATPLARLGYRASENAETDFSSILERAPIPAARCNSQGVIVESNLAFQQALDSKLAKERILRLSDLVPPENHETTKSLLRALLDSTCESIRVEGKATRGVDALAVTNWIAWRLPVSSGQPPDALLIAETKHEVGPPDENLLQSQRWESVGRLAGGVVHDFNNLLTGVMLYCDLLLSTMSSRDSRRRYADEIRSTILQATGLVHQLLLFAHPQPGETHALSLNQIAHAMRNLLVRLIGENIQLEFRLDPALGLVKIDQSQAQQIFLNLVLNARDALKTGGHIVVETSNCRFQTVAASVPLPCSVAAFPYVLLVVSDNGCGMDAKTRQRLFEPFFTTKSAGQGTGLGLSTVRSIVTANRGLIHIESKPGHGTQAMILLPAAPQPSEIEFLQDSPPPPQQDSSPLSASSATPLREIKKEPSL